MSASIPDLVLGVDIGTTGCKTIAADRTGSIYGEGDASYAVIAPRPGWAEQDPDAVVAGVRASMSACTRQVTGPIAGLCFTGPLHSLMAVDAHDRPLTPVLTWADGRSDAQAVQLKQMPGAHARYERTGCPSHPMYPLAKLLWLRENRPDMFRSAARFCSVKEYVIHALTGQWLADASVASGSGLVNLSTLDWDTETLTLAGVERARLCSIIPATSDLGNLLPEAAHDTGVPPDARVIIGASDAVLSNVGAGAVESNVTVAMIGSSGAVRSFTSRPRLDPRERTWCYALDGGHYIVGGAINNGGLVLRWFADHFGDADTVDAYETLVDEAGAVGAGAAGLIFLPFLTGERSPGWNPHARGVLFGLSLHHGRPHVARAILEAVCYRMRSVLEAAEDVSGPATEIRASGGFLKSALWGQIMADVFGRPIGVPSTPNTSALGGVFLGWHALDPQSDWSSIADRVPVRHHIVPDPARHARYSELYAIYQRLYDQLGDAFAEISRFQAGLPEVMP